MRLSTYNRTSGLRILMIVLTIVMFIAELGIYPSIAHAASSAIYVGPAELLYTDAQIPFTFDGSLGTLRNGSTTTYFHTEYDTTKRFNGPPEAPLASSLPNATINMNGRIGHAWITNIYKCSDGRLIGFSHRETDTFSVNCDFYIGITYSTDGGSTWTYLGDILAPKRNGVNYNIGGTPYLVVSNYFYVYFNEHTTDGYQRLSVARASISDVMNAATSGQVPTFYKYNSGTWTENGLTGLASNIIPNGEILDSNHNYAPDFHSDAAFNRALGKYMITVQTHGQGKLLLYTSADGISWGEETIIDAANGSSFFHPYSSFVGFDANSTEDSSEVGAEFYIYFPRKGPNYNQDDFYRRKIIVGPASYTASEGFKAHVQGDQQWYYKEYNGSSYSDMYWNAANNFWQGSVQFAIVGNDWQHPDSLDSVRIWKAPISGIVRMTGIARKLDSTSGDGVRVKIMKNGTQLWPPSGWNSIAYNDTTGVSHDVIVSVAENDSISFIVNQNGTSNNDSTYWDPTIRYISRTASASSTVSFTNTLGAWNLVNSNVADMWSSKSNASADAVEWAYVDLGTPQVFNRVVVYPRIVSNNVVSFPSDFKLQGSNDATSWTDIASHSSFGNPTSDQNGLSFATADQTYRYVRFYATRLRTDDIGTEYYMQLAEIEIYEDALSTNKSVNVSSTVNWTTALGGANVNDGSLANFWTSDSHTTSSAPEWASIDFGIQTPFSRVILYPRTVNGTVVAFPSSFKIQGSNDGTSWTDLVSKDNFANPSAGQSGIAFTTGSQIFRYVRLYATQLRRDDGGIYYFLQLIELEVQ